MKCDTFTYDRDGGWSSLNGVESADLVVVFGCSSLLDHPEVIDELTAAAPAAAFVGCSTAGEIIGTDVRDGCAVAAAVEFDSTSLRYATTAITATTSYEAGRGLAEALDDESLQAIFLLSDGLDVNGSKLVRGTSDRVASSVVVTGGLAADGDRFERTWVIADGKPKRGMVAAVGFYG